MRLIQTATFELRECLRSTEGWVAVMLHAMELNWAACIYFLAFICICTFFVLNLFVGIIIDSITQCASHTACLPFYRGSSALLGKGRIRVSTGGRRMWLQVRWLGTHVAATARLARKAQGDTKYNCDRRYSDAGKPVPITVLRPLSHVQRRRRQRLQAALPRCSFELRPVHQRRRRHQHRPDAHRALQPTTADDGLLD